MANEEVEVEVEIATEIANMAVTESTDGAEGEKKNGMVRDVAGIHARIHTGIIDLDETPAPETDVTTNQNLHPVIDINLIIPGMATEVGRHGHESLTIDKIIVIGKAGGTGTES